MYCVNLIRTNYAFAESLENVWNLSTKLSLIQNLCINHIILCIYHLYHIILKLIMFFVGTTIFYIKNVMFFDIENARKWPVSMNK